MASQDSIDVVIPLDPAAVDESSEALDPWRLLATGNGILVSWAEGGRAESGMLGPSLAGTSQLATQLSGVLAQTGASRAAAAASKGLFTVEVPTGSTISDLVPAVGGGYRGLVRAPGAKGFSGDVRLLPATGAKTAGAVALGPLFAVMALTMGAEMLAQHQLEAKVDRIYKGVQGLSQHVREQRVAQLVSAESALDASQAALLDRIQIPSSIGLGSARDNVRVLRAQALGWLETWETAAEKMEIGEYGVHHRYFEKYVFGGSEDYTEFAHRVAVLYRALVLDTRAQVLTSAEAALHNPHETLVNLQRQLTKSVAANAEAQQRLRDVLWRLSVPAVDFNYISGRKTEKRAAALDRMLGELAATVAYAPNAPTLLASNGRQSLQIVRGGDGAVQPTAPLAVVS